MSNTDNFLLKPTYYKSINKLYNYHVYALFIHFLLFILSFFICILNLVNGKYYISIDGDRYVIYPAYITPVYEFVAFLDHAIAISKFHQNINILTMVDKSDVNDAIRLLKYLTNLRWIEYSVSASLMNLQIATLCTANNLYDVIIIYGLTAIMMYFGYINDKINYENSDINGYIEINENINKELTKNDITYKKNKKTKYIYTIFGFVIFMVVWAMIIAYYATGIIRYGASEVPEYVHIIIFALFSLELSFGILQSLTLDSLYTEHIKLETRYVLLSLLAKTTLSVLLFQGSIRENDNSRG